MQKLMQMTAGAAVALGLSLAPALADGMAKGKTYAAPVAVADDCAASKFNGFYLGIHGGTGSLTSTVSDLDFAVWGGADQVTEDGIAVGGQIGVNWARCNTFFGIEADLSWTNIDSNRTYFTGIPGAGPNFPSVNHSLDWIGSLRTRSGVAVGDLLLYVTGGLAFANIDTRVSQTNFGGPGLDLGVGSSDTRFGWVAGVGTEYAMSDRIRITGDLLYYDFGTESGSQTFGANTHRFDDHHSLWVSRIGLNFKLDRGESAHGGSLK